MPNDCSQIDEKILALFRDRSEDAIRETACCYGAALRALAPNLLGSPEDAEEVENDVYLTAWKQIPPDEPRPLLPYLRTICRRRALDRLDEKTAQKRGGGQSDLILEELEESLPADDGRGWAARISLEEALSGFLDSLTANERKIFLQRYWYFLSVKEVAGKNGIKPGHAKVTLYRLRQKLKSYLEKEDLWNG
ncbi:MAG: sigma-70 family RNA polymerase sigma factor [Lachnospiraceae bacterium]|nr:sigma-70 family RNA polymerase sigma factor [Lachnospiraceae bacterium]